MNKIEKDKPECTSIPPSLKDPDESQASVEWMYWNCTSIPVMIHHTTFFLASRSPQTESNGDDTKPELRLNWSSVFLRVSVQKKPAGTHTPLPPTCSLKPNNHSSLHYVWAEGQRSINMIQYKSSGCEPEQHPPADSKTKEGGRGVSLWRLQRASWGCLSLQINYFQSGCCTTVSHSFLCVTFKRERGLLSWKYSGLVCEHQHFSLISGKMWELIYQYGRQVWWTFLTISIRIKSLLGSKSTEGKRSSVLCAKYVTRGERLLYLECQSLYTVPCYLNGQRN